jgi:hypothetical protein
MGSLLRCGSSALFLFFLQGSLQAGGCPDGGHCQLPRWTHFGAAAFGQAGRSVAIDAGFAAAGAPVNKSVLLYRLVNGQWVDDGLLTPPVGSSGEDFGFSVDLCGDTLLVGAKEDDTLGNDAGAVFIYERLGGAWVLQTKLLANDGAAFHEFGHDVAVNEGVAMIGAPGAAGGAVYHFVEIGGAWWLMGKIEVAGTAEFGWALDLCLPDLIVGDWSDNEQGVDAGAAYYFDVTPVAATFRHKILAPAGVSSDWFGYSVAVDRGTAVIGAYGTDGVGSSSGSAYVVEKHFNLFPFPPSYDYLQELTACDAQSLDNFGRGVAIKGNLIVVGAPHEDTIAASAGAAYTFRRGPAILDTWSAEDKLMAESEGAAGDEFGWSTAIDGNYPLVGARLSDADGSNSGACFLFSLNPSSAGGGNCGCGTVAMDIAYGTGKPGTLGVPVLSADDPAAIGGSTCIELSNALPGAIPLLFLGFSSTSIPFDKGELLVGSPQIIVLPPVPGSGFFEIPGSVPEDASLCNTRFFLQIMFADPGAAGVLQTAQSNGLERLIGY